MDVQQGINLSANTYTQENRYWLTWLFTVYKAFKEVVKWMSEYVFLALTWCWNSVTCIIDITDLRRHHGMTDVRTSQSSRVIIDISAIMFIQVIKDITVSCGPFLTQPRDFFLQCLTLLSADCCVQSTVPCVHCVLCTQRTISTSV